MSDGKKTYIAIIIALIGLVGTLGAVLLDHYIDQQRRLSKESTQIEEHGVEEPVEPSSGRKNYVKDPDGNKYETIRLRGKTWMAENLNYSVDGSFCYDLKYSNCKIYGRLYTWQAAKEACTALEGNWHLPTIEEWEDIVRTYYFEGLIKDGDSEFNALLGGFRYTGGSFLDLGAVGYYWSATERGGGRAYNYYFYGGVERLTRGNYDHEVGVSVRCLQN